MLRTTAWLVAVGLAQIVQMNVCRVVQKSDICFYPFPVKCLAGIMFKWIRDLQMYMICKHAVHKSKSNLEIILRPFAFYSNKRTKIDLKF